MMKIYKPLFLFYCLFLVSNTLFSQGVNCGAAAALTINGACAVGSLTSTTNSGPVPTCNGGAFQREGWYSFVVSSGPKDVIITGVSGNRNLTIQTFSNVCGSLVVIGCANADNTANSAQTETLSLTGLANGTYYIRVSNYGTSNGNLTLNSLCICSPTAPACASYISPANGASFCPASQTLSWNAVASPTCGSISYDVYFNAGTTATAVVSSGQVGTTFATAALSASTTYAWKIVPKNGSASASGCSTFTFATNAAGSGSITPLTEDFESCNDWTLVNGAQTNIWAIGTATDNGGAQSIYVTNDGGTTNAYSNTTSTVHFYKDIAFPAGASCINLSFDWKSQGDNGGNDYLVVTMLPTSTTPVAGTALASGTVIGTFLNQSTWQTASQSLSSTYANTTQRLVFSWINNNNSRANPPAAIDNIVITAGSNPTPGCASYVYPTNGYSACTTGETLSWNALAAPTCGSITYDVYFNAGTTATTIASPAQAGTTYATGALTNGTTYAWKIVPKNGSTSATGCSTFTFTAFTPTPNCTTYISPANSSSVCNAGQTLSWNAVATTTCGSITYDVYFNAGTSAITIVSAAQAGTTYATGALTNGTTYAWKIVPKNGSTGAVGCSTSTFVAINNPVPTCVTYNTPVDGSNVCASTQTLSWNAISSLGCGAITYDVYFNSGNTATTLVSAGQAGTTYVTGALTAGFNYSWKVVAKSGTVTATGCSDNIFTTITSQSNDLPCNAVSIPLGSVASGDNNCTGNTGEPATPGCWTTGTANTVWYSFTAPASGNVKIRTAPGTLLSTQIAVYSGACGSGMTSVNCNQNAANCGLNSTLLSELSLTGLTNGATYYIAVDGKNSLVGTFAITVINSTSSYPVTAGQDCSSPNTICTSTVLVGDPGNQGIGFTCDDPGSPANCTGGERGSVWYQITIANSGALNFVITPNDYTGTYHTETDYDFLVWKTAGAGATSCSAIAAGTATTMVCNYSSIGYGGVYPGGNAPTGANASYNANFEPTINATAGETYLLLVENFSGSTKGFFLDFSSSGSNVIDFGTSTTKTWTGGSNTTNWNSSGNWGSCSIPSCGTDAIISTISTYQPLITSTMGTVSVNNFTIDPGAVLTLGGNSTLKICGNLTNNGTILASPSSTILFSDDNSHTLNGTLSGSSKLGNIIITDAAGGANCNVTANTNVELKGNLTISNTTSVFNLNGKNLSVAGDLINSAGATTFTNAAGSTITFNGSSAQIYNPNKDLATPSLTLNNVVLNHLGTGLTLSTTNTPNMILGTSGVLTLTSGKIITPNSQEVTVMNTAVAAVSAGNTTSYVEGNLRRYLAAGATGSFDFPVGHATPGYEKANVNFTSAAAAGAIQLVARFDPWGGAWTQPAAPGWAECSTTYNAAYLNNGYWSIDASSASTGLYNLTLSNRSYTTSSAGWSIAKSPSSAPSWTLNGNCVSSPVTAVIRNGMSGFSKFATVQGSAPLPVELISFSGVSEGTHNSIYWKSAVETNFRHYELESSSDGLQFAKITTVNPIGNLSSSNNYNYLDFNSYSPITYYRLKMIDLDYTYNYSSIISIENGTNKDKTVIVYPNPASSELFIKLVAPAEKEASIEIKDIYGRLVYHQEINLSQGIDNNYINTSNFASGTYIVTIISGNSIAENIKVIINNKN